MFVLFLQGMKDRMDSEKRDLAGLVAPQQPPELQAGVTYHLVPRVSAPARAAVLRCGCWGHMSAIAAGMPSAADPVCCPFQQTCTCPDILAMHAALPHALPQLHRPPPHSCPCCFAGLYGQWSTEPQLHTCTDHHCHSCLAACAAPQAFMDQWRAYMHQAGKRVLGSTTKADQVCSILSTSAVAWLPTGGQLKAVLRCSTLCPASPAAALGRFSVAAALVPTMPTGLGSTLVPSRPQIVRPPSLAEAMLGVLCECHRPAAASGGDSEVEEEGSNGSGTEYMLAYPPPAVLNRRGRCNVEGGWATPPCSGAVCSC